MYKWLRTLVYPCSSNMNTDLGSNIESIVSSYQYEVLSYSMVITHVRDPAKTSPITSREKVWVSHGHAVGNRLQHDHIKILDSSFKEQSIMKIFRSMNIKSISIEQAMTKYFQNQFRPSTEYRLPILMQWGRGVAIPGPKRVTGRLWPAFPG